MSASNRPTAPRAVPDDDGREPEPEEPTLPSMMGLVAIVVAVVILVFFALGYLFGRIFL